MYLALMPDTRLLRLDGCTCCPRRLDALGALASAAATTCFAAYSTALVDALPKQWSAGGVVLQGGLRGCWNRAGWGAWAW